MLIVPTYFFLNESKVPANQAEYIGLEPNEEIDGKMYYVDNFTFVHHAYAVSTIIGQCFISVFGGIGFILLPYNLLNDFIFRPKPISEANFKQRQRILLPKLLLMRKEAKHLETERMQIVLYGGLNGYIRRF